MSQTPLNGSSTPASELPKAYRPAEHETRIIGRWDAAKAFHADPSRVVRREAKPFCIFIPPPNVTAALHLGHALNNTLQDVLARAHRMMGDETLWLPGTDHAGIATQAVVEKRLLQEEGKRRHDYDRDEFVAKVQAFKDEYEATITAQLKEMGCSCDWDRQRFTMDEQCAAAVREAFFQLFKDGLIYRGKRLVNWDPVLQTAVADDECYDEEIEGHFYYLRYPLVHAGSRDPAVKPSDGSAKGSVDPMPVTWDELAARGYPGAQEHDSEQEAWITVATTRPETYLGDTAVAINPHDPRAKPLRGLFVELPLVGRVIPVIEDAYVVLPERYARTEEERNDPKSAMATGFLKVTPAHDPNDYEIGQRHGLPMVNMMSPDGKVSDGHGMDSIGDAKVLVGKTMAEARKMVVKEFEARGLFEGAKPHRHSVKHSDRSKAVIEPYLSDQWFVKVTDERLAGSANAALVESQRTTKQQSSKAASAQGAGDGSLAFHPPRYAKTYEQWHTNIRDWCISRQLWWGHRIPVWTREYTLSGENPANKLPIGSAHAIDGDWSLSGAIHLVERTCEDKYREVVCPPALIPSPSPHDLPFPVVKFNESGKHAFIARNQSDLVRELEQEGFTQDPDVLDTWFSSALWPLSTLGWPNPAAFNAESNSNLLKVFNPSSVLCTAREIITLWVSRMVMFNRYFTGEGQGRGNVPFRDVFIHAMIQDGEGRKMSKSLGNGVDPRDIISSHGADAMRFTLCQMTTQTQDVRMPVARDETTGKNTSPKFDLGRNFCNKLWNAARFTLGILARNPSPVSNAPVQAKDLSLVDRWMLSRLTSSVAKIDACVTNYEYSDYAETVYRLLWWDFCDWYLEAIKPTIDASPAQRAVLAHALETIVRVLHPIAPFITEAIWEQLKDVETAPVHGVHLGPSRTGGLLCTAGWPRLDAALIDPDAESAFERLRTLISAVREVRSQHQVPPKRRITLHANDAVRSLTTRAPGLVESLAGVESIVFDAAQTASSRNSGAARAAFVFEGAELALSNLADAVDASAERDRVTKRIADLEKSERTIDGRLSNPGYMAKAPAKLVEESRAQLAQIRDELATLRKRMGELG
ncbi:MAG: valine--tRNA ligase [Phycisphaeraceae bacterium]|nr:valine--tRNA ligase [Phycisphaeraceae bacterium]